MSLLGDTIRDAHRPLPGGDNGWLRRMPLEEYADSSPEEDMASLGMQSVSRFQKEGLSPTMTAPREASFRSGGTLADDPLSVESKVEKSSVSTSGVNGNEDIFSVLGDNRGNELATGQVNHRSPSWTTAAKMSSETSTHQSEVMSEPIESDSAHQRHQSHEQQGIARFVSEQEETYQSRVPGQGAPSESFTAPINPLRSVQPGPTPVGWPSVPGQILWPAGAAPGQAVDPQGSVGENADSFQVSSPPPEEPVGIPQAATAMSSPFAREFSPSAPGGQSASSPMESSSPQLVIGRIDVVVVAKQEQAATRALSSRQSDSGFVSRNYLKRL
ncbi:MAG: hypothetical protein PHI97_04960 [Desulfobulbus sp.]|nr:hypothetical protein [Desulfobulbus sp.]